MMRSASGALLWEIWRKNRWSFGLLLALLIGCVGLRLSLAHRTRGVERLRTQYRQLVSGSIRGADLLDSSKQPESPPVRIRVGLLNLSPLELAPTDTLAWAGECPPDGTAVVRVFLDGKPLSDPQPLPPMLTIRVGGKVKETFSFAPAMACAQSISEQALTTERWRDMGLQWSILCLAFSVLVTFAIFGVAEPNAARGFTGIPPRRFTLPVPTGPLVLWPVVVGAAFVLALSIAWTAGVLPGLAPANAIIPHVYVAGLCVVSLAGFQALVWGLPSFPKTRLTAISVLMLLVIALAAMPFLEKNGVAEGLAAHQLQLLPLFAALWILSVVLAWAGVVAERHGRWVSWVRTSAMAEVLSRWSGRVQQFRSPFHAQLWMEWRRNVRLALVLWTLLVWCVLLLDLAYRWVWAQGNMGAVMGEPFLTDTAALFLIILGLAWLAVSGLNLARDGSGRRLTLSSFTAVRPVSTGTLVSAKLLAGLGLWAAAACILVGSWTVVGMIGGYLVEMIVRNFGDAGTMARTAIGIVIVLAVTLNLFVGVLPLCLSGRVGGFPWSLLPWLVIYGVVIDVAIWFGQHPQNAVWFFGLLVCLVFLKLLIAVVGFERALRRGISTVSFVVSYSAIWVVLAGALLMIACLVLAREGWPQEAMAFLPAAVLILPLARIAVSPLALDWNRHR